MYGCNTCGHTFRDSTPWNEVDDRDELIEEVIPKCPRCGSKDVGLDGVDAFYEEDNELDYNPYFISDDEDYA